MNFWNIIIGLGLLAAGVYSMYSVVAKKLVEKDDGTEKPRLF